MVGAIAFLSPYTHTHVDTNIPVSRVWRMGMPQMSGVPGWVWALLIPAVWLGGEPLGLLVLFSSVVNWGMVIPCLPYIAILFLTKIEMRKCLCNCLLNSSFCILQRDILVAKVHLIPLTFIEHLLRSEASTASQCKRRHHPLLKWPCYECFIFLKSMIFWVTVLASSHHSDMINSFIMLDWFNYLLCRFVYLICISIARVLHLSAYRTIILRKVLMLMQVPVVSPGAKTFL